MGEESEDGEETGDVDKDGDKEDEEAFEWLESLFVFWFSLDDADLKRFERE